MVQRLDEPKKARLTGKERSERQLTEGQKTRAALGKQMDFKLILSDYVVRYCHPSDYPCYPANCGLCLS